MILTTAFTTFLKEIRPTKSMRDDLRTGHKTLRKRLNADADLKPLVVSDFLQGSYRRHTTVRPKGDKRSDVDIIVVTKLAESEFTPDMVMDVFEPFLNTHYKGKWKRQGRSLGIELSYVDLDLVVTSAPSEAEVGILKSDSVTTDANITEARDWRLSRSWLALDNRSGPDAVALLDKATKEAEWKSQSLRIPDRDAGRWVDTNPLEQLRWTRDKNNACNGHFVNVVKCLKWWRLEHYTQPDHPKGFLLERIVAEYCPDGVDSVAQGVAQTLEAIGDAHSARSKPFLADYGVKENDVLARLPAEDFAAFVDQVDEGATLAREALEAKSHKESAQLWRELLGPKFPVPSDDGGGKQKTFTPPSGPASPGSGMSRSVLI